MNPNEPSSAAFNLDDLKLLPDWMKADAPAPPGTGARGGGVEDRAPRDRGDRGGPADRGGRGGETGRGGDRFPRRPDFGGGRGGGGTDMRGGGDRRPPARGAGDRDRGPRSGPPRGGPGGFNRDRDRDRGPRPPEPAPVVPARVRIEFVPDPRPLAGIAKEIRASHLAYPLFGLARMFLDRPERHRIRLSVEPPPRPAPAPAPASTTNAPAPAPAATAEPAAPTTLFQLGEDGPVATDRAALERIAFDLYRERFYVEQKVQKDPPKGNFTNVARDRNSGTLLGPTNYHAYQANLRGLYESRFSRRMSFEDFRRDVEIISDPALVERWKEEIRTVTNYTVRDTLPPAPPEPATAADVTPPEASADTPEAAAESTAPVEGAEATAETATAPAAADAGEQQPPAPGADTPETATGAAEAAPTADPAAPPPTVLDSLPEVRQHFRQHYFDGLVRQRRSFEIPGPVGRQLPEPSLMLTLRWAHEQELRYPAGLVQPLRAGLQNSGLHIFKHRKRVVYVSSARPVPFRTGGETGGAVSEQVSAILEAITATPLINRKQLAERVLGKRFGPAALAAAPAVTPAEAPIPLGQTGEAPAAAVTSATEVEAADVEAITGETPAEQPAEVGAPAAPLDPQAEALAKAKASLAADLRYLMQAGHIVEFHQGGFDLPLLPKPPEPPRVKGPSGTKPPAATPAKATESGTEAVATPTPIAEREKAPEMTSTPPVEPPPENEDILAPPADPTPMASSAETAGEEEYAPIALEEAPPGAADGREEAASAESAREVDPQLDDAALAEEFDGPETLPPPPAGVVEKQPAPSPDPTLPANPPA